VDRVLAKAVGQMAFVGCGCARCNGVRRNRAIIEHTPSLPRHVRREIKRRMKTR
jgi:hypothetical protein